jgi:hypothetical protein
LEEKQALEKRFQDLTEVRPSHLFWNHFLIETQNKICNLKHDSEMSTHETHYTHTHTHTLNTLNTLNTH